VPPAVALMNYMKSGILWRIFCQTGTFRGVSSTYPSLGLKEDILFLEYFVIFGGCSEAAMGGLGAQRPVRRGNAPKKTGARSARARTRGQNPLVDNRKEARQDTNKLNWRLNCK
jgi:hypothetical protein